MRKPFYSIVSNKAATVGEMLIYGVIGPDYWGDGVEAKRFVRDFQYLEQQHDRINIRINSPGGSVWDGLPIFNAIRASLKDVHTYNDGIAFSMGAMILLAGKTIHMAKGSLAMLHNTSGMCWGNAGDMRESADMLDKHDDVLSTLIADRSGKTKDEVKATWMDYKDHFLTPQEMIDAKLADVIEDYEAKDMPKDASNMSLHQIAAFYNERTEEPSESLIDNIANRVKNFFNPENKQPEMKNFPKVAACIGVTAYTADVLAGVNAEFKQEGITGLQVVEDSFVTKANDAIANEQKLTGELSTAQNTIKDLEAKVEAFGKNAGANHKPSTGEDIQPEAVEEVDTEAMLSGLAHNRAADQLFN